MSQDWYNRLMSERMEVDQEFEGKLAASEFSRPQWSLIMTATEFDIEDPEDPEQARLVAVTDKLPGMMDEIKKVERSSSLAGGGGNSDSNTKGNGSGLFGGIKSALGLGSGGVNEEQLAAAEELVQDYADDLQTKLERQGKWESVRLQASE